jgi:hypothetical protein
MPAQLLTFFPGANVRNGLQQVGVIVDGASLALLEAVGKLLMEQRSGMHQL